MNCHINCYCLSRKAFHALWVVKDCMPLSPFLTKMTPSRVQVSEILRSRFRVRASQAIVARVFVRSSFMKTWVPFYPLSHRAPLCAFPLENLLTVTCTALCHQSVTYRLVTVDTNVYVKPSPISTPTFLYLSVSSPLPFMRFFC